MKQKVRKLRLIAKLWLRKHKMLLVACLLISVAMIGYVSFMVSRKVPDRTIKQRTMPIEYLVIHYTANLSNGADAYANARYLQRTHRAGTHYCIDDVEVIECTEEQNVAYAVGDKRWRGWSPKPWLDGKVFNNNSLSFEMCLGGDRNDTIIEDKTAQMVGWHLVNKGLDLSRVIRHHDVTGKHCPKFGYNGEWNQVYEDSCFFAFKLKVNKYYQYQLERKRLFKERGIWVDSLQVGQTTLNFKVE